MAVTRRVSWESSLMLITTNPQRTLWETVLPPGYQDLPRELAAVDALLDDPVFFEPYRAHFSPLWGRPSIPIETYLRMMFLKHRVSARTLSVRITLAASALASNAVFSAAIVSGPHRLVILPRVDGCGTRVPSGIRQNRDQDSESATSRHSVS
jgi:hypothetical protein